MDQINAFLDQIDEEIEDMKHYAKWAAALKEKMPGVASTLATISAEEGTHATRLHEALSKVIEKKKEEGCFTEAMQEICSYAEKKQIEAIAAAKTYQSIYKEM